VTTPVWRAVDHVQLAIPVGTEPTAEHFWVDLLGFEMRPKPPTMAARGGRWFVAGGVTIHVGADPDFHPARKAHPAILVGALDALVETLGHHGVGVRWDDEQPGVRRCFLDDPFGNRIELIDAVATG
jgi:catechol 2,3-dioxygenase-like lactoylglutathione lyase family enzyme